MPNRACNGYRGNHTPAPEKGDFVPVFTDFPLTDFLRDEQGNPLPAISDEDVRRMREFDIENKK